MQIGIFVGHPAQFHLFKNIAKNLKSKGHRVEFLVKRKDMLENLVQESGFDYTIVRKRERQSSRKINLIWEMLKMDLYVSWFIIWKHPKIILGTYCPVVSRFLPVSFIVCNEDDASIVPRFAKLAYPVASAILTPMACNCGKWETKATKYSGFQKLAYLHPNQFTPNKSVVEKYLGKNYNPYVLMRFAKLNAHHDGGIKGMTDAIALNIVQMISDKYSLFISSERPLGAELEKYRLKIDPLDMHHLMAFADMYLGDSQSMAVESAILGVPNIRFNDFVAKIGVLNELETKYQLTYGIPSDKENALYRKIDEMLNTPNLKKDFQKRRARLLEDKIDVTSFITWFVNDFPSSKKKMEIDTNFQYNFR